MGRLIPSLLLPLVLASAAAAAEDEPARREERRWRTAVPGSGAALLNATAAVGSPVHDARGEVIARVAELLVDPASGRIRYVVLGVGGTLGVGESRHLVPWSALRIQGTGPATRLVLARGALKAAARLPDPGPATGEHAATPEEPDRTWDRSTAYGKLYDDAAIEELRGRIVRVESFSPMAGMSRGVQLTVRDDLSREWTVHVGPAWYLDAEGLSFKPGELVDVRGSRTTLEGEPIVMAARVARGEDVVLLRDDSGRPAWSGGAEEGRQR